MRLGRHKDEAPDADEPASRDPRDEGSEGTSPTPSATGSYLTDGRSLFRIQHTITEADGLHLDEALLELEDCGTLELILCSAGALERLGLRPVDPGHGPEGEREDLARPNGGRAGPLPIPPVRL